ncbi:aldose epimerase family protein [Halanaerobium sp. ST460_2HS_T2]|uniref:aldose epimerase family protein n=1 Tax=Halanaerobium sp. ST460_2HS_T2 TaxID=2183914 RepID=UPI000DF4159A|nr:aldose epimerase family protein [Halanaerobium sp. ST460_2HS_T2]RCW55412.1 aldose 1-epimerase [Halanaerobium sp. ST460_2HS_T2]
MLSRVQSLSMVVLILGVAFLAFNLSVYAADVMMEHWGEYQGKQVYLYTLTNDSGAEMKVTNYGGRITALKIPDKDGQLVDVVLGLDSLDGYLNNPNNFGAAIGRYGNRIADGQFTLDEKKYFIAQNNGNNHLHGGFVGYDQRVWNIKVFEENGEVTLVLSYLSRDGEEGYPGDLDIEMSYTLTNSNALVINYRAVTDQPTICNLTNHSYFNFNGANDTILDHELMINADTYTPIDNEWIPTGAIADLGGTPMDFGEPTEIGARINDNFVQLENGAGYDHNYVLNTKGNLNEVAATLYDTGSGIMMEVYTTEPGIQLYTGNFLDGSITGKEDKVYDKHYAVCLETQHFPDSPNVDYFPSTVLRPGEVYETTTIYDFSTK